MKNGKKQFDTMINTSLIFLKMSKIFCRNKERQYEIQHQMPKRQSVIKFQLSNARAQTFAPF